MQARWGNNAPTPSFAAHLLRYFEVAHCKAEAFAHAWGCTDVPLLKQPFCHEAIAAAVAVGFVPYRIRTHGGHKVPEVRSPEAAPYPCDACW